MALKCTFELDVCLSMATDLVTNAIKGRYLKTKSIVEGHDDVYCWS